MGQRRQLEPLSRFYDRRPSVVESHGSTYMGLARKGSNRVHIDGRDYRWVVSGNDGYLDLVVEIPQINGQRLVVQFDYLIGDITPRLVRDVIHKALQTGWMPDKSDRLLYFRWESGELEKIR